ncbi:MAG: exodeoxyribonuclease, partial [Solirubrobacteraceae bacterium]|nr:exodeoxyribonuclease [Solirubrobacteraceae bacterium]
KLDTLILRQLDLMPTGPGHISRFAATRQAPLHNPQNLRPPPLGISQGHFHRGLGLRIDLALMSVTGADALVACAIARDYRKGSKPSDHAPLVVKLG